MRKILISAPIVAALLDLAAGSTQAAIKTASMGVSLRISANCTVTAAALNFGSTTFVDSNLDVSTNISVRCTSGTFYYVTMGMGANSTGTPPVRRMKANTADFVSYNLFTDSSRSVPWLASVTTAPTASVPVTGAPSGIGTGAVQNIPVFGRVSAGPIVPGNYADTVAVTVTY